MLGSRELKSLQQKLGHSFSNPDLLCRALTHKSFANEKIAKVADYEALEFLGDSVLGFVISDQLFRLHPDTNEGELSKIKAFLVSASNLYEIALNLKLGKFLLISRGEEKTGGRDKKAILVDSLEAVFAAVYLDGGVEPVRELILKLFDKDLKRLARKKLRFVDFKSTLQEKLHLLGRAEPVYRVVREIGPEHRKKFVVEVASRTDILGRAQGTSKKEAQQRAAEKALKKLGRKRKGEGGRKKAEG